MNSSSLCCTAVEVVGNIAVFFFFSASSYRAVKRSVGYVSKLPWEQPLKVDNNTDPLFPSPPTHLPPQVRALKQQYTAVAIHIVPSSKPAATSLFRSKSIFFVLRNVHVRDFTPGVLWNVRCLLDQHFSSHATDVTFLNLGFSNRPRKKRERVHHTHHVYAGRIALFLRPYWR